MRLSGFDVYVRNRGKVQSVALYKLCEAVAKCSVNNAVERPHAQ